MNAVVLGFLIINFVVIYLVFMGTGKLVMSKVPKKWSFRLLGIYGTLLLLSPFVMVFGDEAPYQRVDVIDESLYWSMDIEEWELEDLLENGSHVLLDQRKISIEDREFTEQKPLIINGSGIEIDHGFSIVVEMTEDLSEIEMTQLMLPATVNAIDVSQLFNPWQWSMTGKEVQVKVPKTNIELHILEPLPMFFHFQKEKEAVPNEFSITSGGIIQWMRIPAGIPVEFRNIELERMISD
ncbi:hypothetical protein [Tindallia californiensis]|uniref:Uncharacterized protein n=1 Tax=Tindallia californiensis TaxID=159292 RepID=A0A1H3M7U7_9FIRM|nr:hypothetical protein [Tindallia californiensis]SDY72683.1 hypothetical protein SAMN05192546_10428 [Tindallia californiensis]